MDRQNLNRFGIRERSVAVEAKIPALKSDSTASQTPRGGKMTGWRHGSEEEHHEIPGG